MRPLTRLGPQAWTHNHVFKVLGKANKFMSIVISGKRMLQRAGSMAEKACLQIPFSKDSLDLQEPVACLTCWTKLDRNVGEENLKFVWKI